MKMPPPVQEPVNLIPDWHPARALVLAWPAQRLQLVTTYLELLRLLPDHLDVIMLTSIPEIEDLPKMPRLQAMHITAACDIWVRDFLPAAVFDGSGIQHLVKPDYKPEYLQSDPVDVATGNAAGQEIGTFLGMHRVTLPLVWDLGNLTHNGRGVAICTDRLLGDNRHLNRSEIHDLLRQKLNIEKLIIVPVEPGDATGHIDGMVRFLSESQVLVGGYAPRRGPASFMDKVARRIEKHLRSEFEIVRVRNGAPEDYMMEGIASAVGNYVNFFRLEHRLYLPVYGALEDDVAIDSFRRALPHSEIIPVPATTLAKHGGVLNCMTWIHFQSALQSE